MKLGVIAGNRLFPVFFSQEAKRKNNNLEIVAICFKGETSRRLSKYVDKSYWIKVGEIKKLIEIVEREKLKNLVMVGQINPKKIFNPCDWDEEMKHLIKNEVKDFRPHNIFGKLIDVLEKKGVKFLDSTTYINELLAEEGIMNKIVIPKEVEEDIVFGQEIASRFVELDIGQTVVVKQKTVVAVESLEGTDNTILRGYRLAKKGCVVLKFSKSDQDLRFDVPLVGMKTLKILRKVGARCLVLEKNRVIILEKEKFLKCAYQWGIAVVGKGKVGVSENSNHHWRGLC